MKEELIELAKEKGFSNEVNGGEGIFYDMDILENKKSYYLWMCLLQQWLRENYNIYVTPILDFGCTVAVKKDLNVEIAYTLSDFKTCEEALEKGLFKALQLIKL